MSSNTKKITEVLMQCEHCKNLTTIEAEITGRKILVFHNDTRSGNHPGPRRTPICHCGGRLTFYRM
jgi:hypothetical protein